MQKHMILNLFSIRQYKERHFDVLSEKIQSVYIEVMHKLEFESDLSSGWQAGGYASLDELLKKFSNVFFTDINLYAPNGDLLATSRAEIFEKRLTGPKIHPAAYYELAILNAAEYTQEEQLGELRFLSAYVPFRNGTLIALATGLAEARNSEAIYIGAVEEDSSGYPDCRANFFKALQEAINQGTRPETKIEIRTPVITMDKMDIIILATKLSAPIHYSWSCYTSEDRACGKCDSCKLRLAAFKRADLKDPILYAQDEENKI